MSYTDYLEEERQEGLMELMNTLIGSSVQSQILEHYIRKAERAIKNYSCIDEIPVDLDDAIIELAIYFYKNRNNIGVIQQSQGSRSQTNKDGIPDSIKCSLPLPRIRVV